MTTEKQNAAMIELDLVLTDPDTQLSDGARRSLMFLRSRLAVSAPDARDAAQPVEALPRVNLKEDGTVRRFYINPENGHIVEMNRGSWVRYVDHRAALASAPQGAVAAKCYALEAENMRLIRALETAHDHIDMGALEISHCKDAAEIRDALAAPAAPVAREPLTDAEIDAVTNAQWGNPSMFAAFRAYARAIEKAHGNTPKGSA